NQLPLTAQAHSGYTLETELDSVGITARMQDEIVLQLSVVAGSRVIGDIRPLVDLAVVQLAVTCRRVGCCHTPQHSAGVRAEQLHLHELVRVRGLLASQVETHAGGLHGEVVTRTVDLVAGAPVALARLALEP